MIKPIVTTLLAASNPSELAEFYSFAMDAEIKPGFNNNHFLVSNSIGFTIQIYTPSTNQPSPPKGKALSLCLVSAPSKTPTKSLREWTDKLESRGAESREDFVVQAFGAEAWIADPEGNLILILVPSIN